MNKSPNPNQDAPWTYAGFDIEASYAERPDDYEKLCRGEEEPNLLLPYLPPTEEVKTIINH